MIKETTCTDALIKWKVVKVVLIIIILVSYIIGKKYQTN